MRGHPLAAAPEHRPVSTTPPAKPRPESFAPARTSGSRKPKVLMGEVAMPRGQEISQQREAFRAFMLAHRLTPSAWARNAGVPAGEVLGFLTGRARAIAPATLEKLARATGCTVQDFFS